MPARLNVHVPGSPLRSIPLRGDESVLIGRDPSCQVSLRDGRVSSRHALLLSEAGGWKVVDQGSKNGTLVNGLPVAEARLRPGDWITVGPCHAMLEVLSEDEDEAERRDAIERRQVARDIREKLLFEKRPEAILHHLMTSVLSVTGAERGFLLTTGADGALEPQVAVGYPPGERPQRFEGSVGAVRRVLATGRPVIASDALDHAFLGKRPSVKELRLRALACVPLLEPGRRELIGALYVDGHRAGGAFSELDLELLEALAEKAALVLEGMRIDRRLQDFLRDPRQAAVLELLSRHLAEET